MIDEELDLREVFSQAEPLEKAYAVSQCACEQRSGDGTLDNGQVAVGGALLVAKRGGRAVNVHPDAIAIP